MVYHVKCAQSTAHAVYCLESVGPWELGLGEV